MSRSSRRRRQGEQGWGEGMGESPGRRHREKQPRELEQASRRRSGRRWALQGHTGSGLDLHTDVTSN